MSEPSLQKKRKRVHENGTSQSNSTSGSQSIRLDVVKDAGERGPALVFAPGLDYAFKDSMNVYSKSTSTRGPFQEKILLHSANHPKLDFVAQEEKAGDAGSLLQHFVAVHDPKTGTTQVVRARKLTMRSTLQSARTQTTQEETIPDQKTTMDSRIMLGQAFGTKKSQKALRERTENAIASTDTRTDSQGRTILDDAAAVVIDTMGESYAMTTKASLNEAIDEAKPRPKANLAAETPAEVYLLEDLTSKDICSRLNISGLKSAARKKQDIPTFSRYFSTRINKIAGTGVDNRMRALRLILTLIEWRKLFIPARRNTHILPQEEKMKQSITDYDPLLMEKLRKKFAPDVTLSAWHIDNIHTHICAISLIVDEYTVDTFDLKFDLGLDSHKIVQCFREIGCRTVAPKESEYSQFGIKTKAEVSNHTIAKLRIPLVFPKVRQSRAPNQRR